MFTICQSFPYILCLLSALLGLSLGVFIGVFCSVVVVLLIALLLMIRLSVIKRKKSREEVGLKADTFLRDIVYEVSDIKDIKTKKHEAPVYNELVAFVVTGKTRKLTLLQSSYILHNDWLDFSQIL